MFKLKFLLVSCALLLFLVTTKAQEKLYKNEFPLSDVKLLDGAFKHARDLNIEVLLKYDVDRLLAPYRKEAGLTERKETYPNWDGLDGHVAGHYLSAMSMNYAATGNKECKRRMEYIISELQLCLEANAINNAEWAIGYIGGFPNSKNLWSAFKKGDFSIYHSSWAPFYNLHKMYAGLRDAWLYCGNKQAKTLFLKFCDWAIDITAGLKEEQMQSILKMEYGGMNEIFADAYQITGNDKYLVAAKRYSENILLDSLSQGVDNLDNKHANTQIPKFVGFARIAELSGDAKYTNASRFSWETITTNRSLAFGGNSRREHFPGVISCSDYTNDVDGPESCNSYNMLKLTEDLFRMQPSAAYADYYERTVFNHILSTQHPVHGGYVYFTSARPRHYRVYSAPNEAMWCCVGTGMENHSKYNQFIYTHSDDSLFVNLFIASELNWKDKKISIRQETNFPYEERTKLTVTKASSNFKLMLRYPGWVDNGALKVSVNGKAISYSALPSSYICIDRKWNKGDVIEIELPMRNTIERLPNVPNYLAFMHGPILLGAKTGIEDLRGLIAGDGRWGQYPSGKLLPVDQAPILIEDDIENISSKLVPIQNEPLHFKPNIKMVNPIDVKLEPFANIHDARYMMYWLTLTNKEYRAYMDSLSTIEKEKMMLEKRTLDFVAPGEQQPETDHKMQQENSKSGNANQEYFREASSGGYFSYEMKTNAETELSLIVRYWGAEWGGRKFDIYIDDEKLLTEDNTGRWNQSKFQDIKYDIPASMLEGKNNIRVKFQSIPGNTAGSVYFIRLVRKDDSSIKTPEKEHHVYLCLGQSNMEGNARFESQDTIGISHRFMTLQAVACPDLGRNKGQWYKAVPPLARCHTGLTPADYFGRTMIDSLPEHISIGIINVSIGGCKIELFDKSNYQSYVDTAPDWLQNMVNEYDGNPYGRLVELARQAMDEGALIKGILLHQGESNTGDKEWPQKVKLVYNNLLADLNLSPDSVPLVAGELVNEDQQGVCSSMNEIIRTLPEVIPNSHVVSSAGCKAAVDKLHFSAEGYRELGKRYAEKVLTLTK